MKPVALESSEKTPHLQPQPPSSPAHSESRRGVSKSCVKRSLKTKLTGEKATTDSAGVKSTAGDGSTTSSKPATITKAEQPHQEPSAKRTVVRLPKTSKDAASADLPSVMSTAANWKSTCAHLPAGRSPQTERKSGEAAASTLTNRTQVRLDIILWFIIQFLYMPLNNWIQLTYSSKLSC